MTYNLSKNYHLPILIFLNNFNDDEFHEIPNEILNQKSPKEKFEMLNELSEQNLVIFNRKLVYSKPVGYFTDLSNSSGDLNKIEDFDNNLPIHGKLTNLGRETILKSTRI